MRVDDNRVAFGNPLTLEKEKARDHANVQVDALAAAAIADSGACGVRFVVHFGPLFRNHDRETNVSVELKKIQERTQKDLRVCTEFAVCD
jgi:hypothetical protein